ncbi:MAG: hypothetical protein FWG10_11440 [Eubacteriaceae bacterium]|nr:hypothetical protein [Eubacteriaceae bacterium]
MNIIRTTAVELSAIPAIAYKQKLGTGGSGIKLFRLDTDESAVFTIDRRTGQADPFRTFDSELFPEEAVLEALELTSGLPYTARGKLKIVPFTEEEELDEEDVAETDSEKNDMVKSEEYLAIIERYTDEKGKLNYQLMNKDFIQFASKSKTVSDLLGQQSSSEDILLFIVKSRAAFFSGNKDTMTNEQTAALIETLDEIDPRSAFKDTSLHIRRLQTRANTASKKR